MIITFHNITDRPRNQWELTPEQFKKVISTIPLEAEIHFDDAREGAYKYAYPILENKIKQGQKVTIFIVPNWIDGFAPDREQYSKFIEWKELKELSKAGLELGSHSLSHQNLTSLPSIDIIRELTESKDLIETWTGCTVNKFAYPYGAYTHKVIDIVKQHYSYAYGLQVPKEQNNWNIHRKTVINHDYKKHI